MNYRVLQKNNKWAVVETRSGLIIKYFKTRELARKVVQRLNQGAGFDGWTPIFMSLREAA